VERRNDLHRRDGEHGRESAQKTPADTRLVCGAGRRQLCVLRSGGRYPTAIGGTVVGLLPPSTPSRLVCVVCNGVEVRLPHLAAGSGLS